MVTFSCEVCNESMLKKKADQHAMRCRGAYFTCIDCSTTFNGYDYKQHNQCITEDQKYQKALYRPKKKDQQPKQQQQPKKTEEPKKEEPKKKSKSEEKSKVTKPTLKEHKGKDLYKALKKFSKDEKKELLKKITIKEDGTLELFQ